MNIPLPLSRGDGCRITQAATGEMEGVIKVPARDTEYRQGLKTPVKKEPSIPNPAGVADENMLIFCNPCGVA